MSRQAGRGAVARARQKGAVMIVALMLLLVMTVLAVSGVGSSLLEQEMSGNHYHSATAFEAAEFGLRVAEKWLFDKVKPGSSAETWFITGTTANGLYTTQNASRSNSAEVCRGDIDCRFDPLNENSWCTGGAGCALPKGFATLGTRLEGHVLDEFDMLPPGARQPQFIIEHVGRVSETGIDPDSANFRPAKTAFRITAIGWGQEGVSRHVLQSHVVINISL